MPSNRLSQETSPYLLQHADNPVDWYPWSEQALTLAREQDKPILLSIGYSSCHWCHVMAQECFSDQEVAELMSRFFINIKVDREERPDLDHVYQMALLMMTRRGGGWPLTMFLSPEQIPFFGGTYFPKHARYQLNGLMALLPRVHDFYHSHKPPIAEEGVRLVGALQRVGHVLGNAAYLGASEKALRLFYPNMLDQPMAHTALLFVLKEYLTPHAIVVVRDPPKRLAHGGMPWQKAIFRMRSCCLCPMVWRACRRHWIRARARHVKSTRGFARA